VKVGKVCLRIVEFYIITLLLACNPVFAIDAVPGFEIEEFITDLPSSAIISDIATDASGRVYLADFGGARLAVYDAGGTYLKSFTGFSGYYGLPTGVSIDDAGRIFVSSSGSSSTGDGIGAVDIIRSYTGTPRWSVRNVNALSVACGPTGTIYVSAGHSANEITKATIRWFLGTASSTSQLAPVPDGVPGSGDGGPDNIALSGDYLYVSEQLGSHIYRIHTATGTVESFHIASLGNPEGLRVAPSGFGPYGDSSYGGNLILADQAGGSVLRVVISGGIVTDVHAFLNNLESPEGMCFDQTGALLVADNAPSESIVYRIRALAPPTSTPTATETEVIFTPEVATDTPTSTYTYTPTDTSTSTPTPTSTYTPTATHTYTPTNTYTYTPTDTSTSTSTPTATYTYTPTNTYTHTSTDTPTSTHTPTATHTHTPTNTYTYTPTDTSTSTPTPTATSTSTPTNTYTYTPTATNTPTDTATSTATRTRLPNEPPDVSQAYPSKDCLWEPAFRFVDITVEGVTDPDGDPITIIVLSITSDEPTATAQGAGSPRKSPDAYGIGTSTASLRSERSRRGDGRVYEITFVASDGRGGETVGSVKVCVSPNRKAKTCDCVDDGQNYDATEVN